MTDEERQRTMDFIVVKQAQFTIDIEELKKADERAERRIGRVERVLKLAIRAGVRERRDFRERYNALADAQIGTEEITRQNTENIRALTENIGGLSTQNSEEIQALIATTNRNSEDIQALIATTNRNGEDIQALIATTNRNGEDISNLAKIVGRMATKQNGNGGEQ